MIQNTKQESYWQQLEQVRDSLTEETWGRDQYFGRNVKGVLCFCVHGAAQMLTNPNILKSHNYESSNVSGELGQTIDNAYRLINSKKSILELWQSRHFSVKEDTRIGNINYGNSNLNYLMGLFGITPPLNDRRTTTLQMLKEKLNEAIDFARENEEFLANN